MSAQRIVRGSGGGNPAFPPHLRELEESFLSSLGWGLHVNYDREERFGRQVSEGLGLAPGDIAYPDLRDLFLAIRDDYLTADAFTWQGTRQKLWQRGWFQEDWKRHTTYVDIVCNQFTTVGAIPRLRTLIEQEAALRRGEKHIDGAYE
jgi:hypothetical protein